MTDLEDRIRESLRDLVDAYKPLRTPLSTTPAAPPRQRSSRTITIAAALLGAALAVGIVIRLAGSDSVTRLETDSAQTTIAPIASPAPATAVVPSSTSPADSSVPPASVTNSSEKTPPSEAETASAPLEGAPTASCAFEYNEQTLSQRGFAFDGIVVSIGDPAPDTGFADPYVPVQFAVNQWFKGDGPTTFSVRMFPPNARTSDDPGALGPQWDVGSRLLISGESQYGAGVLVDPVVWFCGFSRTYDEATANLWRNVFSKSLTPPATTTSSSVHSIPPSASTSITRPYINPSICADGSKTSYKSPGSTNGPIYPFAHGREAPIPIQIIGNPAGGPAQPFAVLLRYVTTAARTDGEMVTVNGIDVGISIFDNGNGHAQWTLPDGSNAYMRTRGLDRAAIVAIVGNLTPRDRSVAVPGFDYQSEANDAIGLTIVAETLNTDFAGGLATRFACTTANGYIYRVDVLEGDTAYVYLGVIDRSPPLQVANNGGGAVMISGLAAPTAPDITDVVDADPSVWDQLPSSQR